MPEQLLGREGARPTTEQGQQMQGALLSTPAVILGGMFVNGIGNKRNNAQGYIDDEDESRNTLKQGECKYA